MDYNCWNSAVFNTLRINNNNIAEQPFSKLATLSWDEKKILKSGEIVLKEKTKNWGNNYRFEETAVKGGILICFEFVACYFALIQIFGDICTFFFLLRVMSHPEQNPCITKQLDQKPPVMQQGCYAPYLLPRWEMEGESVSGREGRRIWEGGRRGRAARTRVWLTATSQI